MKTSDKWINNVADFCLPKKRDIETDEEFAIRSASNKYIKVSKDFAALKGSTIRMKKFEEYVQELFDKGIIQKDEYDKKMALKSFIKYVLTLPPQKEIKDIPTNTEWINNAVDLRRSPDGNFYIKVKEDFCVKKGDSIPLKKSADKLLEMKEKGMIDAKQYQERLDKLKVKDADGKLTNNLWLIYDGSIPPEREEV